MAAVGLLVRDAVPADAAACAAVYAPYVRDTTVTFETDVPSTQEMAQRIAAAQRTHAWLVLEDGGRVVGYAYAGPFRTRAAYRWSCEVSVYLEVGRRRGGGGRALYQALFDRLRQRGYRRVAAGMALPNEPSEGLHRALGFTLVGTFRRVGWKHGAWHDVAWVQRDLVEDADPPLEPHAGAPDRPVAGVEERQHLSSGGPWEAAVGYARAVRAGTAVFVSGTTAALEGGGVVGGTDAGAQAREALRRIGLALEQVGARLEDVVRTRVYVTDISRWPEVGAAHAEVFGAIRPAATMVEVARLIDPALLVEIEADAVVAPIR